MLFLRYVWQEMWAAINWRKAFLPALWAFLDNATHGATRQSYANILPLVSLLPAQVKRCDARLTVIIHCVECVVGGVFWRAVQSRVVRLGKAWV